MASLQQGTPEWHAARRGKLTASNVGAAVGINPFTTRMEAFNRALGRDKFLGKTLRDAIGPAPSSAFLQYVRGTGNCATRWGTANESNGVLAYSAHTGNVVKSTGLHVHRNASWLAGSPDGLIGEDGMIEVKCPYWPKRDGRRVHLEIPPYYYLQINLCLECTDREWCDFISWSPEAYKIIRVTRDTLLHEALTPTYVAFFAAMSRNAQGPPLQSKAELQEIKDLVAASMAEHIDEQYWSNVDPTDVPPTPEPEEACSPPPKRTRVE